MIGNAGDLGRDIHARRRKGLSQRQLSGSLGISQGELSRRERTPLDRCTVAELEAWAGALGAHLAIDLRVDGERPLADERHAAIEAWLATLLRSAGWMVELEVSFNHYGDRGRIDLFAWHPGRRVLLVVEVKTRLTDAQELLGGIDVKRRVAPQLARSRGWETVATIPALVLREDRTTRRRIGMLAPLFESFSLRARAAIAWLRRPTGSLPAGILLYTDPSPHRRAPAAPAMREASEG